ncbi:hypothetical protein LJC01_02185 [Clostridiaceae bacterium OttesenSCG-928-D20]|nr:hypothetical protein [Clostridiaceae bacterium OttesenSCG-928-D20]
MRAEIYETAKAYLGKGEESEKLQKLCQIAGEQFLARLRDEVTLEEISENFVHAAAILALSMYITMEDSGEWTSFSAGSISVSRRNPKASAEALRFHAEEILSRWLKDRGFYFKGVRG